MVLKTLLAGILLAVFMPVCGALAQFDAQAAQDWLDAFVEGIAALEPKNDVSATADPARAGEYLLEYDFGTVVCTNASQPGPSEILLVELKAGNVSDCRGISVGQTLEDVIAGREIAMSDTPLYVLATQESGYGWSWVYVSGAEVYGVEYITYGGDELSMKEYTLTYVIDGDRITAIRLKVADASQAQAIEGLKTAEEIAGRQFGTVLITENSQPAFSAEDMTADGRRAVGIPVEALIALIGEPREIQALPGGSGRILVYDQAIAELVFDEMTGVEVVRSIGCASQALSGPRGIQAGMSLGEAAGRFRCDGSVYSTGGDIYLAGEAQGIAPFGEMICSGDGLCTLRYACEADDGSTGVLDIVIEDEAIVSWNLYLKEAEAAYGG